MTRFEWSLYILLIIAMCGGFLWILDVKVSDYSAESRAIHAAKVVHCDMGQIPLDCIQNPKKKSSKKSTKKNYIP